MRDRAVMLAGATLLLACTAGAPIAVAPAAPAPCRLDAGPAADSVRITVAHSVTPGHAPLARDADAQFVFAQLYEPLVRIDCNGTPVGALASSWAASADGRTWTVALREDATFWDDSPVTAHAVASAWAGSSQTALAWVSAAGEREVRIGLRAPAADPGFLADPALVVVRRDSTGDWPIGTGPYRPRPLAGDGLRLVLRDTTRRAPRVLRISVHTDGDLRGALDTGTDALVARTPGVLAYARALPAWTVVPLPWNRTWVLATLPPAPGGALSEPPADARTALARDAAVEGTRAAAPLPACDSAAIQRRPPAAAGVPAAAIAYLRGDEIGRGVAERLAALAWPRERTPPWLGARLPVTAGTGALATAALDERDLAAALRTRAYAGVVVALPRTSPCRPADALQRAVRAAGVSLTALVDGRDHLVFRRGLGAVLADADGTLRLGARP